MNRRSPAAAILSCALLLALGRPAIAAATRVVSRDGKSAFGSIQAAIDSIPDRNAELVVIEIAPGRYDERLIVRKTKPFIVLRGMGNTPGEVWIGGSIAGTGAILTANADDFRCEHLTLEDASDSDDAQGRSALIIAGQRQAFEDCELRGRHNTVFVRPRAEAYLHMCSITGTGDIVYGAGTAFVDTCDVSVLAARGTIASPNTPGNVEFGLAFVDCRLRGPSAGAAALMRPWGPDGAAAFIRCSLDDHFSREGWAPWEGREATCRAREVGSTGPGEKLLDLSKRPPWVRRLSAEDAQQYTVAHVFPGWNPHGGE